MNGRLGTGLEVWRLAVLAVLILLSRRLPIMMGLYRWIPDLRTWREAAFYGHFGPMGITAIFMSTLGNEFLRHHIESHPSPSTGSSYQQLQIEFLKDTIQPTIAFIVLCSIIIHGLSIPSFSLGRRVHSLSRTWSRRDTTRSGRSAPDWTNQATLVPKAKDIIINQDLEGGGIKGLGNADVKEVTLKENNMTEEANFKVPVSMTPSRQTAGDQDHHFTPEGERHQSCEWGGNQRVLERSDGLEDDVCWSFHLPLSV